MKRTPLAILLFGLYCTLSSSSGCKLLTGYNTDLHVNNNSAKGIYYVWGSNSPDTLIPDYPPLSNPTLSPIDSKIAAYSSKPDGRYESPQSFFEHNYPSGKASFFVFDAAVLETTNWDTVRTKYLILKRYDLTLDSLKKMNYTISYP